MNTRMTRLVFLPLWFLLLSLSNLPPGQSLKVESDQPVVRALMFWMDTCGHCQYVLENVLPPLQARYGDKFELLSIQLVSSTDVDRLYGTAAEFGIPDAQVGVPFLVIGDQVLIGSDQVEQQLPGLIESYLASGGVDYPQVAALEDLLPTAQSGGAASATPGLPRGERIGFILANVILVGMIAAIFYVVFTFARGRRKVAWKRSMDQAVQPNPLAPPQRTREGKRGLGRRAAHNSLPGLAVPILAIIGLGVSAYLAYVETQAVPAVCGPIGDCNAVQSSTYAKLFGVLPVGILGLIGYAAILGAWILGRFGGRRLARSAPLGVFGIALAGTLFSIYLTYLEPYVIEAVCAWCLSSALIITLLLLLSLGAGREALEQLL
jgi:uncharacterized membrane protein